MPPLTRQEQRDREEFVNRYMRENPDADDVEAEDLWEDRRSGDGADGVDDGPEEPLPQSEAQPVRDEGANEPTAPAAPTSPSAPPTGGPESAPTPKLTICLLVLGFSYALGGTAYALGYNPLGIEPAESRRHLARGGWASHSQPRMESPRQVNPASA